MDERRFPEILKAIYALARELEVMFDGLHFTPDGHMVGSIGEAIAKHYYGVALYKASNETHDGERDGRRIQVKATQRDRVAISSCPDFLLVISILEDGTFAEEYNGPGSLVWSLVSTKKRPKNGQYQVSLSALRRLKPNEFAATRLPHTRA